MSRDGSEVSCDQKVEDGEGRSEVDLDQIWGQPE